MNGRLGSNTVKVTEIYQQITTSVEEYMSRECFWLRQSPVLARTTGKRRCCRLCGDGQLAVTVIQAKKLHVYTNSLTPCPTT